MEDSYYYKLRSIENDLKWIDHEFKTNGFDRLVNSESRRKTVRELVIAINKHAKSIQSQIGQEFRPEF